MEVRSSLPEAVLLHAARDAKPLEAKNVLYAPHIVTVRYCVLREPIAMLIAAVAPRSLMVARFPVEELPRPNPSTAWDPSKSF